MRDPVPRGPAVAAEMDGTVAPVPDYFEPVIGWRAWLVVATARGPAFAERRLRNGLESA